MKEISPFELKKGYSFQIKGKRKKYIAEDIFVDYLFSNVTVYYRVSAFIFKKLRLKSDDVLIIFKADS